MHCLNLSLPFHCLKKKRKKVNVDIKQLFRAVVDTPCHKTHTHTRAHLSLVPVCKPPNMTVLSLSGCDKLPEEHLLERSRVRQDPETLVCVNGLSLPWTNAGRQMSHGGSRLWLIELRPPSKTETWTSFLLVSPFAPGNFKPEESGLEFNKCRDWILRIYA